MTECILLIPGFFGSGTIGAGTVTEIVYFDKVIDILARAARFDQGRISGHEPRPTVALEGRVASLFRPEAERGPGRALEAPSAGGGAAHVRRSPGGGRRSGERRA